MCRSLVRSLFSMALAMGLTTSLAWADNVDATLYFTTYAGGQNVNSVHFVYAGGTISPYIINNIASTPGADGIVFAPDGDLLIGGQNAGPGGTGEVYKVNIAAHTFTGVTTNTPSTGSYHLSLDPSGLAVWSGGIPGELSRVPLNPFAAGTAHPVTGSVTGVDSLAFVPGGSTYYTSSINTGNGTVGIINMTTFATTHLLTQAASHGMVYDPFTHCLMICGANSICQFDPTTNTVVGTRNFTVGGEFDQMSVDGHGHAWIANNDGNLLFIDYDATGQIFNAGDYTNYRFLDANLDDLAPNVGLGSPAPAPAGVVLLGLGGLGLAGWQIKRRRPVLATKAA